MSPFRGVATRAACYRMETRGNAENGWGGCWEECWEHSGRWQECQRGCCSSFLSKDTSPPLAAPSPALPPAPRIFQVLFPAPSPFCRSLRAKGTLISEPRPIFYPCEMFFPREKGQMAFVEGFSLKRAVFPFSRGKNRISQGSKIGAH